MKACAAGIFSIAILFVVTGVGVGIAQASGIHSERPVSSYEDLEAHEHAVPSHVYAENRPVLSFENEQILAAGGFPSTAMELQSPVETGALPSGRDENPAVIENGGMWYRVGLDTGP